MFRAHHPNGKESKIRILIVDDHVLFAESIRHALEERGLEVIGVATNGVEALAAVAETSPSLVLLDLGLPDQSGLELGRTILERHHGVRVIALTALADSATVGEAMRIGFSGYMTKDVHVATFVDAVLAGAGGDVIVPDGASSSATTKFRPTDAMLLAGQLTEREREVLHLLVAGGNGRSIARTLAISPNTVRTHVQSILTKLQVHSRLEAVAFATRHGLLQMRVSRRVG